MGSKNHDRRTRRTVLQTIGASGLALFVAASSAAADDGSETGTSTEGDDADPDEGWAWEATKADTPDPDEGWAWDAGDDSQDPDEGWAWDVEDDNADPDEGWAWNEQDAAPDEGWAWDPEN